jgi:glycosyltransferase involved in cell wall biosynthesis
MAAIKNILFSKLPYSAERFIDKNFEEKLVELLQIEKYDVIQLEGLYMTLYIPIIRKFSDGIIVLRAHNIEHQIWERVASNEKNILRKKYLLFLSKRIKKLKQNILNSYDAIVPITEHDAKFFQTFGNNKPVHVSQTGFDIYDIKRSSKKAKFPSFFHIGALDWAPNQEGLQWFFKNVWNKVLQKNGELKFHIAGRNAPDWLFKIISLQKNVIYLGEVPDAYDFMNSKSVMIVPLLSGSGMRIKIIEGMALGKTIISTNIGTEGINSTHKKDIFLANTPDEFIQTILELSGNETLCERVGEKAIDLIRTNFDNTNQSAKLIDFYKEIINQKFENQN